MLEEKIVELTEAIKELTLWVKSNDSTPVEDKPKTKKRRTKKEIEAEKTVAKIEVEQREIIDPLCVLNPSAEIKIVSTPTAREEAPTKVDYDMVKNAAKALVNIGPGGPGLAKAAAIRDKFGYAQLADIEPKDFRAIECELREAVKTWGK